MDAAIIWTYGMPLPGHEADAMAYWFESTQYWTERADEGLCTPLENFMSGSAPFNIGIVRGEHATLFELAHTEAFQKLTDKGMLLLSDYHYWFYETGEGLGRVATAYMEAANELTHSA